MEAIIVAIVGILLITAGMYCIVRVSDDDRRD